ncbi:MAG TPA: uroporphyrinogen-III C-methyltransferase [Woeseiaceae bacterium]
MTERSDDEHTGPEGPAPESAAPPEPEPAADLGPLRAGAPADEAGERGPDEEPGRAAPAAADVPRARRRLAGAIALLALLVALATAAGLGWLVWSGRGEDATAAAGRRATDAALEDLSRRIDELDAALAALGERADGFDRSARDRAEREDELTASLDALRERMQSLPPRVASLESAVASLAGISSGSRRAWLLAEAEHYMEIANSELQLAGDPEQALLALRFAEERIRSLEDPALTGVREALANEIRAVDAMETPDVAGVTMTLASLADHVASLPLAQDVARREQEAAVPGKQASGFARAMASVKAAFSDVVSVRRSDEEVRPLLSPEAEYFLRENLALRLQIARLAVLRGEQGVLDQALADVHDWLQRWFDLDSRAVQSALGTIEEIGKADWSVTPPDISTSLRLLRELRERRDGETAPPARTDAEPAL